MKKSYWLAAAACICIAAPATAKDNNYRINLPAQPLSKSLFQISEITGLQVIFTDARINQLRARSLSGTFSVEEMLRRLMENSGYGYTVSGDVVRIDPVRKAAANKISAVAAPTSVVAREVAPVAEDPTGTEHSGLEEIVVTAQKRTDSLQDTPIAISVLGGEALRNRGIRSISDFVDGSVPSLRIASVGGRPSALIVGMRGIVPFDASQMSRDMSVGIYVDGVPLTRVAGLGTELVDVERIEVLKGPQGTLFGRNAVGGAVSIVSRKPSGEFHVTSRTGISNYDGFKSEAHIDLPKVANFSLKLDGIFSRRDGTVDNPLPGQKDYLQYRKWGVHAALLWEPDPDFSARYDFDKSYDASTPYYNQILSLLPGAAPLAPLVLVQPDRADTQDVGVVEQSSVGKVQGHALHLDWTVAPKIELRSITAYRSVDQSQYDNGGAHLLNFQPNGLFARYSQAFVKQHQVSQEFQLVGSSDRFQYVGGLFYFHERGEDSAWTPFTARWNADGTAFTVLPTPVGGPFPDRASFARATSKAAYGQITWTPPLLDDRLHLTVGARYTIDKKNGRLTALRGVDPNVPFNFSSKRIDPSFVVAFDATREVNLYAKWGRAYRAGGANSRSFTFRSFGEEEVSTTEIGIKSELFDRHLRINLAAYQTDYKKLQIDFGQTTLDALGRLGTSFETVNTDRPAKIKGFEADITAKPIEAMELGVSYAYTKATIPDQINPFTGLTQAVNVVLTPRNAISTYVDLHVPIGSMTGRLHLDANAADGYYSTTDGTTRTDPSFIVNGRLSLDDIVIGGASKIQFSLWSRNLFNEQHVFFDSVLNSPGLIAGRFGAFNEPRTYGAELMFKF